MIVIVDYHKGNLKNVERALASFAADVRISDDPGVIDRAGAVVLPGVGAFADAARTMNGLGQMQAIARRVRGGVFFLGICLGMHLMFAEGAEGANADDDPTVNPKGLGFIPGVVGLLPHSADDGRSFKIPHVGWNAVDPFPHVATRTSSAAFSCPLFSGIDPGEFFYFTHSYAAPDSSATVATTTHSLSFPAAVQWEDNAFGVQFHPEKSSSAGLCILKNFVRLAKG